MKDKNKQQSLENKARSAVESITSSALNEFLERYGSDGRSNER